MLKTIKPFFTILIAVLVIAPFALLARTKPAEWVVFDGVRNFSYSMVCCLVDNNIPCTVLVRPQDMPFAETRLPASPLITIIPVEYDAAHTRPALLETVGAGAKYLFLDPEDDNFKTWPETVIATARNALYVARKQKLTLFYPARIYIFDNTATITEKSVPNPISLQGRVVNQLENMLNLAAQRKHCKIRKVRVSYAFGPAIYDYLMTTTFKDMPTLGRLTWLFRTDKPHQFCYSYDVARLTLALATYKPELYELNVQFSGYTYPSVEAFAEEISKIANVPLQQRIVSKLLLSIVTHFEANAKRGSDLSAYFEQPAYMEDSIEILNAIGFQPTETAIAIAKTLAWFAEHPADLRSIFRHHQ